MRSTIACACWVASVACGGTADKPEEFTCAIGELSGTWRFQYRETNGNCGPIPDETSPFDPGGSTSCRRDKWTIAEDKCSVEASFSCPATDGLGTTAWVLVMRQTAEEQLNGTGTAELNHATLGTCRSTYDVSVTKL